MDRKHSLVKNIFIFGFGTSLSKLMSVLLVGFYTAYISLEDYGYYDILVTMVSTLTPLITLQITDALYRHLLEARDENDAAKTITGAFAVVAGGLCLATVIQFILYSFSDIRMGWILPGYFIASILFVFSQQTARGLKRNSVYAVSGIVTTGVMLAANIILIVGFGMGVEALLYSTIIADVCGIILIEATVGIFRRVRFYALSKKQIQDMLRYSIPLLPNAVTWWLMMLFNRYAIKYFVGLDANGLFGAASKFPALLMTVYGIFGLAWQENAILEYGASDRNEYYTKTFRMYFRLLTGAILLLLPATRHIVSILINERYYDAWVLIPFLYMGSMFQAFSNFYATIYMGAKRTMGAFVTMVLGVGGGIALCLLTIPRLGAQAAALAHMTAFLLTWLMRTVHTRKYAQIKLNLPVMLPIIALSALYIAFTFRANQITDLILFAAAIPIFIIINKDLIVLMLGMVKGFLSKRKDTL